MRKAVKKWLYGSFPGLAGAFPYFGTKVYFPKGSHLFNEACRQGIFECDVYTVIRDLIAPETFYFDVGANIGLLAVPFLQETRSCQVVSFEPSPNVLPYLAQTHHTSPFRDRWTIIPKAASNAPGEDTFTLATSAMSAFEGFKPTGRAAVTGSVRVQVTTLDIEWEALGRPRVSVIKCDVEGAEINVFEGARKCISANRPSIVTEWNAINLRAYKCHFASLLTFAYSIEYGVYTLPSLVRIMDPGQLKLWMLLMKCETYLLAPCEPLVPA